MDNAALMRVGERRRDLAQQSHGLTQRELAVLGEPRAERLTLDERHREVRQTAGLAGGEQRHDVRVLEPRRERNLALETLDAHLPRHLGWEDFHHHVAAERLFGSDIDVRHSATAKLAVEGIRVAEGALELVAEGVGHEAELGEEENLPARRALGEYGSHLATAAPPIRCLAQGGPERHTHTYENDTQY